MYSLLTFPSNEFDLKNIAATVVPTLVDPKRRVRLAALGKFFFNSLLKGTLTRDVKPLVFSHKTTPPGS
jgi:hypothetical protein